MNKTVALFIAMIKFFTLDPKKNIHIWWKYVKSWINQTLDSNLDVIFRSALFHRTSSDRDHFLSFPIKNRVRRNDGEGVVVAEKKGGILKSTVSGFIKDFLF